MSKFNTKEKVRSAPTTVNQMGERAYKKSFKEELVSTVLTTFVQKSYYESENEILTRIRNAAQKNDPEFVAKLALYTRREANMRSSSHVLAGDLAKRVSGKEWAKRFYNAICIRPDDMSEILAYYYNVVNRGKNKVPVIQAMKKGFRDKLESLDPYLIDKYKMSNRDISLVDLVNYFHPKPNQVNAEAYKRFLAGESLEGLYESKILEKEMSKSGGKSKTKVEVDKAKEEAIEETLNNVKGMPIFNLLRNLRNILLYAPNQIGEACRQLEIPNKIEKSRLLPFRFAAAYNELESLNYSKAFGPVDKVFFEKDQTAKISKEEFEHKKVKILDSLEIAINLSCNNIPKLIGNTAILIDHSGSMRGDSSGHSKVSAFSKVTSSMIANLFGCMLMHTQDNVYMGLFGDRLIPIKKIDRSKGVLKTCAYTHRLGSGCGAGTEDGLYQFMGEVVEKKIEVNNLIIFSDMQIGDGHGYAWDRSSRAHNRYGRFQDLFKKFKALNPGANVMTVNLKDTRGTSVFNRSLGVTEVSGWSEKIFDSLNGLSKGYDDIIAEIEKIKL